MCRVGFRVTKPKSYFTKLGVRDMQKMNIPERAKYCALVSIVICLVAYAAWLLSGEYEGINCINNSIIVVIVVVMRQSCQICERT